MSAQHRCGFEHEDGAYVLGALSPEDRRVFEEHLTTCESCSLSVRELAGLPGLMARVPVEDLTSAVPHPPVPDSLLPGLLISARRQRRRRAWLAAASVAAAAAVVAAMAVAGLAGDPAADPTAAPTPAPSATRATTQTAGAASPTESPVPFRPVGAEPLSGWLSLTPVAWGTRLDLTCSYSSRPPGREGRPPGGYDGTRAPTYTMVLTHADGSTEQVASWNAEPGQTMHLAAATAAARGDITRVEVRNESGEAVLELSG